MARNRPCGVCGKWFYPNARQGERQHTCGLAACKKEWHRRACAKWHDRNPGYDQHTRLVTRLVKDDPPEQRGRQPDPLNLIDWAIAKDEVGLKVAALVEETGKVLLQVARDAIPA